VNDSYETASTVIDGQPEEDVAEEIAKKMVITRIQGRYLESE